MPIPLVPVVLGAGLGALLLAGKADKGAGKPATTTNATPTQQSTGGPDGGAQAPSHADATKQPAPIVDPAPSGGAIEGVIGYAGGAIKGVTSSVGSAGAGAIQTGQEAAFTGDPWAPSSGPSITDPKADLVGLTTKAVGDAFVWAGNLGGAIW